MTQPLRSRRVVRSYRPSSGRHLDPQRRMNVPNDCRSVESDEETVIDRHARRQAAGPTRPEQSRPHVRREQLKRRTTGCHGFDTGHARSFAHRVRASGQWCTKPACRRLPIRVGGAGSVYSEFAPYVRQPAFIQRRPASGQTSALVDQPSCQSASSTDGWQGDRHGAHERHDQTPRQ